MRGMKKGNQGNNKIMYRTMIITSIVAGFLAAVGLLGKKKVPVNYIGYSAFLNLALMLYLALGVTAFLSGFKSFGLNSSGGALGIIIGTLIISKIIPKYKNEFISSYMIVLPLEYGIGKIGCAFAGCCGGIPYTGPGSIHIDGRGIFPIQAVEAITFIFIFIISAVFYLKSVYNPLIAGAIYAFIKILLDFLRDTHNNTIITSNQIMCFVIAISFLIIHFMNSKKHAIKCITTIILLFLVVSLSGCAYSKKVPCITLNMVTEPAMDP